jgi:phosphocarrier protein HPr
MKSFSYVITDAVGIHARPAGMLVKEVKKYDSKITLTKAGKKVEAGKLMAIMTLGVKCGDEVVVEIEGGDEETAFQGMQKFFEETL